MLNREITPRWNTTVNGFMGGPHAVLWQEDGSPTDLGNLGGTVNVAASVNDRGEVVGGMQSSKDGKLHALLWTKETGLQAPRHARCGRRDRHLDRARAFEPYSGSTPCHPPLPCNLGGHGCTRINPERRATNGVSIRPPARGRDRGNRGSKKVSYPCSFV